MIFLLLLITFFHQETLGQSYASTTATNISLLPWTPFFACHHWIEGQISRKNRETPIELTFSYQKNYSILQSFPEIASVFSGAAPMPRPCENWFNYIITLFPEATVGEKKNPHLLKAFAGIVKDLTDAIGKYTIKNNEQVYEMYIRQANIHNPTIPLGYMPENIEPTAPVMQSVLPQINLNIPNGFSGFVQKSPGVKGNLVSVSVKAGSHVDAQASDSYTAGNPALSSQTNSLQQMGINGNVDLKQFDQNYGVQGNGSGKAGSITFKIGTDIYYNNADIILNNPVDSAGPANHFVSSRYGSQRTISPQNKNGAGMFFGGSYSSYQTELNQFLKYVESCTPMADMYYPSETISVVLSDGKTYTNKTNYTPGQGSLVLTSKTGGTITLGENSIVAGNGQGTIHFQQNLHGEDFTSKPSIPAETALQANITAVLQLQTPQTSFTRNIPNGFSGLVQKSPDVNGNLVRVSIKAGSHIDSEDIDTFTNPEKIATSESLGMVIGINGEVDLMQFDQSYGVKSDGSGKTGSVTFKIGADIYYNNAPINLIKHGDRVNYFVSTKYGPQRAVGLQNHTDGDDAFGILSGGYSAYKKNLYTFLSSMISCTPVKSMYYPKNTISVMLSDGKTYINKNDYTPGQGSLILTSKTGGAIILGENTSVAGNSQGAIHFQHNGRRQGEIIPESFTVNPSIPAETALEANIAAVLQTR